MPQWRVTLSHLATWFLLEKTIHFSLIMIEEHKITVLRGVEPGTRLKIDLISNEKFHSVPDATGGSLATFSAHLRWKKIAQKGGNNLSSESVPQFGRMLSVKNDIWYACVAWFRHTAVGMFFSFIILDI